MGTRTQGTRKRKETGSYPPASLQPDPLAIYAILRARFGHGRWWPGDGPLEVIIGAILTQNTNWRNVEKAIANLKAGPGIDLGALADMEPEDLQPLIRPAGYYRQKSARLSVLIRAIRDPPDGIDGFLARDDLRDHLLGFKGIGPETADSICLYASDRLEYVIDAYTLRWMGRYAAGLPDRYHTAKEWFEARLHDELDLYRDLHFQIVMLGKYHCNPKPKCEDCPLTGTCQKLGI